MGLDMHTKPGNYYYQVRCKDCHYTHILAEAPSPEEFPYVRTFARKVVCGCGLSVVYAAGEIKRVQSPIPTKRDSIFSSSASV